MWSERNLFGGAVTCSLPSQWRDVSTVRQVPDNQEVHQEAETNVAVVIEILEYQNDVADDGASLFFFNNLADDNGITSPENVRYNTNVTAPPIKPVPSLTNVAQHIGCGEQKIAPGRDYDVNGNRRDVAKEWIRVELCVLRLKEKETDILVTLCTPCAYISDRRDSLSDVFLQILNSLNIRDWSLFG